MLFRVGRKPDVWQWTDWRFAGYDGTFGCRWDDPQGRYRVLYASASPLGAYLEALAPFRPDPHLFAACAEIDDNDDGAPQTEPAGVVPAELARAAAARARCLRWRAEPACCRGWSSVSRFIYEQAQDDGMPFAGIFLPVALRR